MRRLLIAIALLAILSLLFTVEERRPSQTIDTSKHSSVGSTEVVSLLKSTDTGGFSRVESPRDLTFPPDHGPHPDMQIEWWYTTSNLESAEGHRYGVEVTFFRFGLPKSTPSIERQSAWATDDLFMAHFALTDVRRKKFHSFERFSRNSLGLAGAEAEPWRVWNETWSLTAQSGGPLPFPLTLRADGDHDGEKISVELQLDGLEPPLLQGDRGYSRKGPEPGNASHYYSYPRLEASGSIEVGGVTTPVEGLAWFDHEWSTSVLSEGLAGWDWFALQFEDGTELMVYEMRRDDGTSSPFSVGVWIDGESVHRLSCDHFQLTVLDSWRSSITGIEYPSRWKIEVPSHALSVEVVPVLADQELRLSTLYWEGAVDVSGSRNGWGYVELVGYGEQEQPPE